MGPLLQVCVWVRDDEMENSETKIVIPKKTDVQGG